MLDQTLQVSRLKRVQYIEEVFSFRYTALSHLRWEVQHELFIVLQHWPDIPNRKFIVQRYIDSGDLFESQQGLIFSQHFLQKIFVHHVLRRQVKLHWTGNECVVFSLLTIVPEVSNEICLGAEPAEQFLRHMTTLFGPHQLFLLLILVFHKDTIFNFN